MPSRFWSHDPIMCTFYFVTWLTTPRARGGSLHFLGGGELGALTRAYDWSRTPLGPIEAWPRTLRITAENMLASRHPMFLWWGDDLIQLYNDGYRASLADHHPQALGARGREFWAEIWPVIGPQIEDVLNHGVSTWHEDHLVPIDRNGHKEDVYWTYSYSPVRDDDGTVGGVLVTVQETTERVKLFKAERTARARAELAEARLTDLIRQAPTFIAVLRGLEHVFEVINDEYSRLIGGREVVGKPVLEALPEVQGQGFIELLDDVMRTGTPFVGREMPISLVRSPGTAPELRFMTFTYHPLASLHGTPSGILVHGMDVTEEVRARAIIEAQREAAERARAEAELARETAEHLQQEANSARAEAERANAAKGQFLANMSHELRTPLNAIQGHLSLIDMGIYGPVTKEQHDALVRVERAQRHLLGLITDVLNFERLDSGHVEYTVEELELHDVVTELSPMIEPQLAAKHIDYEVLLPDGRVTVLGDRDKLMQVLLNLLSNAIKFTADGGRIVIETPTRADGVQSEDIVFVRVSDTGIGIPRDKQDVIFEPFVQVRADRGVSPVGAGLGLSISRDLARGMGGDLRARSTPGTITTFTVTLRRGGTATDR